MIPHLSMILQSLLYGFGDPISKIAFDEIPVYTLLSCRYGIALLLLLLMAGRKIIPAVKKARIRDWLLPCLCVSFSYVCGNIALTLTAATSVAFLRSLSVVITPLLAWAVYHKKLRWKYIPVLLGATLGLYLLCARGGLGNFGTGEIFTLGAAALMAGSLVFGAKSLERIEPLTLTALQIGVSLIVALIPALLFENDYRPRETSAEAWLITLYLGILCSLTGFALQNYALSHISARTAALIQCNCPVFTALFSFFLLGENLSFLGVTGAVLITISVIASIWLDREKK